MKHLISLFDLTSDEVREILDLAHQLKTQTITGHRAQHCAGRFLTLVFEKPSLRTRVSFQSGFTQLGGNSLFLDGKSAGLEGRETTEDIARVLGGYSDLIVLRTFSQQLIETFAAHAGCCVINGLSDEYHPCQALTDIMTLEEHCEHVDGRHIVYVGDGNNVARSLAVACGHVGASLTIAAPQGYWLSDEFLSRVRSRFPHLSLDQTDDPRAAVRGGADLVYTDVWASMGQEDEKDKRARDFADFQVNKALMDAAGEDSLFMHCLPARRGLEVTADVMEDSRSIVFEQAENRMHLAKGLMLWLLRH
jgi:ornithine carbamoyltransferase